MSQNNISDIWNILQTIPDPEIPVISVVELGVIRNVVLNGKVVEVTITPTYSGCPAMNMIEANILLELGTAGYEVKFNRVLSPAWTTDWLSEDTRTKLKEYGIAPPNHMVGDKIASLLDDERVVNCPRCDSPNTKLLSDFGSTACKALWFCKECQEPFDYFKCH